MKSIHEYLYGDKTRAFPNEATAQRNQDAALEAHPWLDNPSLKQLAQNIVNENASVENRRRKLIKLVDRVGEAMAPYVACRRGCSSCCNIPTIVFKCEAEIIAKTTGRPMVDLPMRHPEEVRAAGEKFYKTPCPFLVNSECSIYEVRPFTCRQHHSLDDTAAMCSLDTPPGESSVPVYNGVRLVELPYVWLLGMKNPMGDIREFFPTAEPAQANKPESA